MGSRLICIFVFFLTCSFSLPANSLDYPVDYTFEQVPDPLSLDNPVYPLIDKKVPSPGKSFYDLYFGTVLTRMTRRRGLRHEYSRFDPFNANHSLLLMTYQNTGRWWIYRTTPLPCDRPANLVMTLSSQTTELRWDRNLSNIIWGLRDFKIIKIDVETRKETVVKDFAKDKTLAPIIRAETDLFRITTKKEGEASLNNRFWALCLQGQNEDGRLRHIFTWDQQKNKILGVFKLSREEAELIDWVGMSPLGKRVLILGRPASGRILSGLNMADKKFRKFYKLTNRHGHSDVGLDDKGREVIVMVNTCTGYVDLIPLDFTSKPVKTLGDYEGNGIRPLIQLTSSTRSIHISCNYPGYCVVSTFCPPDVQEDNWLDRMIAMVKLDREKPSAYYLAKLYNSRGPGEYVAETKASISNDGTRIVWTDNWSLNVGEEQTFIMQLTMPSAWSDKLDSSQLQ